MILTQIQYEYLLELEKGPKTTNDLVLRFGVTAGTVAKTLRTLRELELVTSRRGRGHSLTKKFYRTKIEKNNKLSQRPITEEEIRYIAILQNSGLTGQRRAEQFAKVFDRSRKSVSYILAKARARKLCR